MDTVKVSDLEEISDHDTDIILYSDVIERGKFMYIAKCV